MKVTVTASFGPVKKNIVMEGAKRRITTPVNRVLMIEEEN